MPELPEVEVLVRHLDSRLPGLRIRQVDVLASRSLRGTTCARFRETLLLARFGTVRRRGKHLLLTLRRGRCARLLIIHLGMTGRLYLDTPDQPLPRHARVVLTLDHGRLVFEDTRGFGGMTLDASGLERLGPEPLDANFSVARLGRGFAGSRQPVKVRLLDQSVVAGIGNIYASEALFVAGIDPRTPSGQVTGPALRDLRNSIRRVLRQAIRFGGSIPLHFGPKEQSGGLFYYGQSAGTIHRPDERFHVYDRQGQPCRRCGAAIRRIVQAGRSTFFCPGCQRRSLRPLR